MTPPEWISRIRLNERTTRKVLFYLLFLLCFGVAARAVGAFFQNHAAAVAIAESAKFLETQNSQGRAYLDAYVKGVEKLKEKGIFCPEKKEAPPQVTGILGDSVLLSGKWCKVNEEHTGAKVLKIEPTQVTLLWKGKEMKLAPLLASNPNHSTVRTKEKNPAEPLPANPNLQANAAAVVQPANDDPLAWLGMEISAGLRAFLLKLFDLMPADQLENAKKEWAGMSDEQKKQRLAEAQQMVDSGQADQMLEQLKANKGS